LVTPQLCIIKGIAMRMDPASAAAQDRAWPIAERQAQAWASRRGPAPGASRSHHSPPGAGAAQSAAALQECGKPQVYAASDRLYTEGDPAAALYTIQSGALRACRYARDGRRQVEAFYREGDLIGLENGCRHTHSAEALCATAVIAHPPLHACAAVADGGTLPAILAQAVRQLARAQAHAMLLARGTASEKLSAFLLDWAMPGSIGNTITLPMPRNDIADYLGVTPETVSRELHEMQRHRLISLISARQIMLVDPAGLRRLRG